MTDELWSLQPVDVSRPHFEVIHSLFKQTAARIGWNKTGSGLAFEFLLKKDPQAETVRKEILDDLTAKLKRLSPQADSVERLFEQLRESCSHLSNMYTPVHWCPIEPESG